MNWQKWVLCAWFGFTAVVCSLGATGKFKPLADNTPASCIFQLWISLVTIVLVVTS